MKVILAQLGRPYTFVWQACLFALFGSATLAFILAGVAAASLLGWNPALLQVAGWTLWFVWLGGIFARRRHKLMASDPSNAYRRVFYTDILFGVSFGVAQMGRPAAYWILSPPRQSLDGTAVLIAVLLTVLGAGLLWTGFRTIGFDGAGFVYEYGPAPPSLVTHGVYSIVRHPLFFGGVTLSLATAIPALSGWALPVALTNLLALPVYRYLEDRRLADVFGAPYAEYANNVKAYLPVTSLNARRGRYATQEPTASPAYGGPNRRPAPSPQDSEVS